jgi:hypothetical protein
MCHYVATNSVSPALASDAFVGQGGCVGPWSGCVGSMVRSDRCRDHGVVRIPTPLPAHNGLPSLKHPRVQRRRDFQPAWHEQFV